MTTMQSILDLARLDINDANKVRNPDANMIQFANDAIARVYAWRPDLRYGSYATPIADLTTASAFPFPNEYRRAVANYVVMSCETSDDPFALEQRAVTALKMFIADLGAGGSA